MKTIAVMQPYFFPYMGYFRLFAAADVFVFFDCVQFPRRGYVHRNQMPKYPPTGPAQQGHWLTLPVAYQPQDVRICDLRFTEDAASEWEKRLAAFPWTAGFSPSGTEDVLQRARAVEDGASVTDYLVDTLEYSANRLGIVRQTLRSSSLNLPDELSGEDRILEIVRQLNGTHYVNAPNGRSLYDSFSFEKSGVTLSFLSPFVGSLHSAIYEMYFSPLADLVGLVSSGRTHE